MALLTGIANQAKMALYDGVNFKPGWHELEMGKALLQKRGQWNRINQEAYDVEEEDCRDSVKERSLCGGKVFYWHEARTETNVLTESDSEDRDDDDDTGSTVSIIIFSDEGESSTRCSSEDDSMCENTPLRDDTKQVFGFNASANETRKTMPPRPLQMPSPAALTTKPTTTMMMTTSIPPHLPIRRSSPLRSAYRSPSQQYPC